MGDILQQIVGAIFAIAIALAGCVAYFWGTNWLLDRFLGTEVRRAGSAVELPGGEMTRRDNLNNAIRPWLFLLPALLFLAVYLVYPALETFRLSFFDKTGNTFVGLSNYTWAFGDANFRQSIFNNIIWLIVVPSLATGFGLVIAVLADRLWWGNIAKSLVFMPMAISFVGASVIWKFVYDYRGEGEAQIGLLNAIVTGFGLPPQAWITLPLWNSLFLMVILIWIQTGFAMVILSAALRGVPEETLEAARIDGANGFQIFFGIMIPQIWGTIVVVWTTITIVVLKVFDIIFAMTNGQWDTEVLANLMFKWMFVNFDNGRGSAIAVIIMIAVLPIMIWNIRRANGDEGTR
jgi:alpha-glucoside transport system permease protein